MPKTLALESSLLAAANAALVVLAGVAWHRQVAGTLTIAIAAALATRACGALGDLLNARLSSN